MFSLKCLIAGSNLQFEPYLLFFECIIGGMTLLYYQNQGSGCKPEPPWIKGDASLRGATLCPPLAGGRGVEG